MRTIVRTKRPICFYDDGAFSFYSSFQFSTGTLCYLYKDGPANKLLRPIGRPDLYCVTPSDDFEELSEMELIAHAASEGLPSSFWEEEVGHD